MHRMLSSDLVVIQDVINDLLSECVCYTTVSNKIRKAFCIVQGDSQMTDIG